MLLCRPPTESWRFDRCSSQRLRQQCLSIFFGLQYAHLFDSQFEAWDKSNRKTRKFYRFFSLGYQFESKFYSWWEVRGQDKSAVPQLLAFCLYVCQLLQINRKLFAHNLFACKPYFQYFRYGAHRQRILQKGLFWSDFQAWVWRYLSAQKIWECHYTSWDWQSAGDSQGPRYSIGCCEALSTYS